VKPLLVALLLLAAPAAAQTVGPPHPAPADGLDEYALLARDARASRIWYGSWIGVQLALDVANVEPDLQPPERGRYRGRMLVGAGTAAIGLGAILIAAPPTLGGVEAIERRIARGELTEEQGRAEARRVLLKAASAERGARQILGHVGNFALNFAAALLNSIVFRSPDEAWGGFLVGITIGEAQIWTRPRAAWRAMKRLDLLGEP
jgi:catechol 2,3-dioxygenase-like lactoylglutathione lyase family enzyme